MFKTLTSLLKSNRNALYCMAIGSFLTINTTTTHHFKVQNFQYPATKEWIRGEYENKIRMNSSPEKIFEIFATVKKDNKIYMSPDDLFKAICPYNYTTKKVEEDENDDKGHDSASHHHDNKEAHHHDNKEAHHQHEKHTSKNHRHTFDTSKSLIMNFVDPNNDGLIGVHQFYYLVLILQVNDDIIKKTFLDLSPEPGYTKEQFQAVIKKLITSGKTSQITVTNYMPDPRRSQFSSKGAQKAQELIVDNLFKGKEKISLEEFLNLKHLMFREIYTYEFNSFNHDEHGRISGEDFAKSIICYLSPQVVKKYMKNLDNVKWKGAVTLHEYIAFQEFLQVQNRLILEKLEDKAVLTKKNLSKIMKEESHENDFHVTDTQLDIFIKVLDFNGNKLIDKDEFVGVVKQRSFYGSGQNQNHLEKPFVAIEKATKVWMNKINRIWDILVE